MMHRRKVVAPPSSTARSQIEEERVQKVQSYVRKWNTFFDKTFSQWMSFKPSEGMKVYPCYSCRDIFGSKSSFVDHINRRGMLIQYTCPECPVSIEIVFYNPCAFLMHARMHFTNVKGEIDLENVKISVLPLGLAGFFQHPDIPLLYNGEEDNIGDERVLNTRFYTPMYASEGVRVVVLKPLMLMFYQPGMSSTDSSRLVLKQLSLNVPCCKFVVDEVQMPTYAVKPVSLPNASPIPVAVANNNGGFNLEAMDSESEEFCMESEDEIVEVSNRNCDKLQPNMYATCPECNTRNMVTMLEHFRGRNKPARDFLRCRLCKYIAATKCSLEAHERIHTARPPFVCPECGKSFDEYQLLIEHIDFVCFHLAKLVRYKCSAKNCGKIFATSATYAHHFLIHLHLQLKCNTCNSVVYTENEFDSEKKSHDCRLGAQKLYKCTMCYKLYNKDNFLDHVHKHCKDTTQRIYVYNCKYCKSYFRSRETYAVHFIRCSNSFNIFAPDLPTKLTNKKKLPAVLKKIEFNKLPYIRDGPTTKQNNEEGPTTTYIFAKHNGELKVYGNGMKNGDNLTTAFTKAQLEKPLKKQDILFTPLENKETDPLALSPNTSRVSYVFKCRFCTNIFTSRVMYIGHLLKCSRGKRKDDVGNIDQIENVPKVATPKLSKSNGSVSSPDLKPQDAMVKCVLCNEKYSILEIRKHLSNDCKVKYGDVPTEKPKPPEVLQSDKIKILTPEQFEKLKTPVQEQPVKLFSPKPQKFDRIKILTPEQFDKLKPQALENLIKINSLTPQQSDKLQHDKVTTIVQEPLIKYREMPKLHIMPCTALNSSNPIKSSNPCTSKHIDGGGLTTSPNDSHSSKGETEIRRKRKKLFTPPKPKKPAIELIEPMPEQPMSFTGTYYCKLCTHTDTNRQKFQEHILDHRNVSTSYQCMDCGECFVVKPSLIKHLNYMHHITDTEKYLVENNCVDKAAVKELVQHMRMVPGETEEPVKDNQCKVCRKEFPDQLGLNLHFRVHGMAFLMKNLK